MTSYDQWKTTDPSQEGPTCPLCGGNLYRIRTRLFGAYWECEECGAQEDGPDPDYAGEAERDER